MNIKIRAWQESVKAYFYYDSLDELVADGAHGSYPDLSQVELYTGKKDANNIEIYEGDILDHPGFDLPIVVSWNEEGCEFESMGLPSEWGGCELIGSIKENPEMINGNA